MSSDETEITEWWTHGHDILTSFPGASDAVVEVIITGAEVEVGWAGILAALSSSDPVSATLLLGKLRNITAQESAVLEVAQMRLAPDLYEVMKIASLALRSHRNRRNAFAHCSWARSTAISDAIFLVPLSGLIRWNAGFGTLPYEKLGSVFGISSEQAYRAETFALARAEALEARFLIHALHDCIRGWRANLDPGELGRRRELVLSCPSYKEAQKSFRRDGRRRGGKSDATDS